jgi:phenylpyruvate tautomerase PptA (4-oxalocrotonate tautomerase family)
MNAPRELRGEKKVLINGLSCLIFLHTKLDEKVFQVIVELVEGGGGGGGGEKKVEQSSHKSQPTGE